MSFKDLRDFVAHLEKEGKLKRISHPVDPDYEMTEISDRTLRAGGPALLFENPIGSQHHTFFWFGSFFHTEKKEIVKHRF